MRRSSKLTVLLALTLTSGVSGQSVDPSRVDTRYDEILKELREIRQLLAAGFRQPAQPWAVTESNR